MEDEVPRMVKTPWSDEEMPFEEAAEIGTKKVITEHSTIGILVTTDGTITEIPREDYVEAEERVVKELKAMNKPFVIVLNSSMPYSEETINLARNLEEKYEVSVIPCNCTAISNEDVENILGKVLYEFPVERINIKLPGWIEGLDDSHNLKQELYSQIKDAFKDVKTIKNIGLCAKRIKQTQIISNTDLEKIDLGKGAVNITIGLMEDLFYKVLSEITGVNVLNEADLFSTITDFAAVKKEYDKISAALQAVKQKGYGIVTPTMDELILDEPEMVKQGSRYGVRLRAKAPSIHLEGSKRIRWIL